MVVDASNLQRNLYFATQVIELGYPTVVALNLMDVAPFSLSKSKREGVITYHLKDGTITIDGSAPDWRSTVPLTNDLGRIAVGTVELTVRGAAPGTVIDLAFYQGGADSLRLGEAFHHNGLALRCAQISRVPRGFAPLWDRRRLAAETVALLRTDGPAIRQHLVTHVVPFDEGADFLRRLPVERPDFLQVVFAR